MPSYKIPRQNSETYRHWDHHRDDHFERMTDSRHHDYPKHTHQQRPIYAIPTAAPRPSLRRSWPPAPSVEDEEASLSREHSPSLPELDAGEAKERGSIDQLPIMMEVGKDSLHKNNPSPKAAKKSRGVRFEAHSSDDSSGPETPTETPPDSESSKTHPHPDVRKVKRYDREPPSPSSPSIQDVLRHSLRPGKSSSRVETLRVGNKAEDAEKVRSPREPSPYVYRPRSRKETPTVDYFTAKEVLHPDQYPGTLKELKSPHDEHRNDHLPFAERHRTMSGSNNAADHRPHNVRHMSAMGYAGESKTPSFPRDHPMHISPDSERAPQFRKPQPHKSSAVESDTASDEDLSPDEKPRKVGKQRVRDMYRTDSHESHGRNAERDYPVRHARDPPTRSRRPSTPPERRPELPPRPQPGQYARQHASHPPPLPKRQESKQGSLPSSPASPTAPLRDSSATSSRPSSRDGSLNVIYPTIKKRQHTSRPTSPVAGAASPRQGAEYFEGHHHASSSLRNESKPSSPTLHTSAQMSERRHLQDPSRHSELPRSRGTSPHPISQGGRSPKPDLRVDVQAPTPEPGPKTWAGNRPDLPPRPISGGLPSHSNASSPKVPMTAPFWATGHHIRQFHEEQVPSSARPGPKPRPVAGRVQLATCPRSGFVTGYHDWWTLPQIPELDICPTCKESLEDNGVASQFVRCKERPPGYKTRCDMTVPWVRMAWLLVLQGRANSSLIRELMFSIGHEEPCPERDSGIRHWHRIYDPESGKNVSNFDICPCCVRSIETIFPNLRGAFQPAHPGGITHPPKPHICDLTGSPPRFARYVDLLEEISNNAAHHRREPNMIRFIQLAKTFSDVRPCRRDDQFRGIPWHYIPHLPDFTVCEECYVDVVWPAALGGSGIAKQVAGSLQMPHSMNTKLSCQLYSARMRRVFEESCKRDDFAGLRKQVMARVNKERELQGRVDMVTDLPNEWREAEMARLVEEWKRWE